MAMHAGINDRRKEEVSEKGLGTMNEKENEGRGRGGRGRRKDWRSRPAVVWEDAPDCGPVIPSYEA